jgi:sugar phosphate isomerase/epimerase
MLGIWGWNHLSRDAAERARAHEMLDRAIGYAETLGAVTFVTGGGMIPGASIAEHIAEFAKVFPPFLERVWNAGMKMAFYAVHGQSFFESIEAYEAAWEHFPEIGIKYDPANWMHHGDDYLDVVRRHGDKIGHVHIKEHMYKDGELISQPAAGMGDVEFGKVMAFLYEHGYDGYLSFEPHGDKWSQGALREKMLLLSKKYMGNFVL